jgi:hypothetical protein
MCVCVRVRVRACVRACVRVALVAVIMSIEYGCLLSGARLYMTQEVYDSSRYKKNTCTYQLSHYRAICPERTEKYKAAIVTDFYSWDSPTRFS